MKGYSSSDKLVVRDSLDLSDISEVEDDVFIRDGRTCKTYEDTGLKRPLMAPRRKTTFKGHKIIPIMKKRSHFSTCCEPFCYGLIAITILIGKSTFYTATHKTFILLNKLLQFHKLIFFFFLSFTVLIFVAALLLTVFPLPLQKIKLWLRKDLNSLQNTTNPFSSLFYGSSLVDGNNGLELVPCTQITVRQVWSRPIGKLSSETPLRKADLNGDGFEDIIIGYGIGKKIRFICISSFRVKYED